MDIDMNMDINSQTFTEMYTSNTILRIQNSTVRVTPDGSFLELRRGNLTGNKLNKALPPRRVWASKEEWMTAIGQEPSTIPSISNVKVKPEYTEDYLLALSWFKQRSYSSAKMTINKSLSMRMNINYKINRIYRECCDEPSKYDEYFLRHISDTDFLPNLPRFHRHHIKTDEFVNNNHKYYISEPVTLTYQQTLELFKKNIEHQYNVNKNFAQYWLTSSHYVYKQDPTDYISEDDSYVCLVATRQTDIYIQIVEDSNDTNDASASGNIPQVYPLVPIYLSGKLGIIGYNNKASKTFESLGLKGKTINVYSLENMRLNPIDVHLKI